MRRMPLHGGIVRSTSQQGGGQDGVPADRTTAPTCPTMMICEGCPDRGRSPGPRPPPAPQCLPIRLGSPGPAGRSAPQRLPGRGALSGEGEAGTAGSPRQDQDGPVVGWEARGGHVHQREEPGHDGVPGFLRRGTVSATTILAAATDLPREEVREAAGERRRRFAGGLKSIRPLPKPGGAVDPPGGVGGLVEALRTPGAPRDEGAGGAGGGIDQAPVPGSRSAGEEGEIQLRALQFGREGRCTWRSTAPGGSIFRGVDRWAALIESALSGRPGIVPDDVRRHAPTFRPEAFSRCRSPPANRSAGCYRPPPPEVLGGTPRPWEASLQVVASSSLRAPASSPPGPTLPDEPVCFSSAAATWLGDWRQTSSIEAA